MTHWMTLVRRWDPWLAPPVYLCRHQFYLEEKEWVTREMFPQLETLPSEAPATHGVSPRFTAVFPQPRQRHPGITPDNRGSAQ